MDLNTYFQLSVSVFCTLAVVILIIFIVWSIMIKIQIGKLMKKIDEIIVEAKTTSSEIKDFVDRTIASLEKLKESIVTFEFIKKAAEEIIGMIKNKKGEKNGQES